MGLTGQDGNPLVSGKPPSMTINQTAGDLREGIKNIECWSRRHITPVMGGLSDGLWRASRPVRSLLWPRSTRFA